MLETTRLVLRKLHTSDAPAILALRSDQRVNEFLDRPATTDLKAAKDFISKIENSIDKGESFYWGITLKENNKLAGTICLWNFEPEKFRAEVGFELHPDYQGKGIMQESLSAVLDYAFNEAGLNLILAFVKPGNIASVKILMRNNFILDENNTYMSKESAGNFLIYYLDSKRQ
jgi:ribosomal-protein-alanine N-acetyltransferase